MCVYCSLLLEGDTDYTRGVVLSEAEEGEEILYADIEAEVFAESRAGIPVVAQRRFDVYKDVSE